MKVAVKNEVANTKLKQNIQLVDGVFTVSEAYDVVQSLIDEKINFHKLQRLSLCEGSLKANTKFPDTNIIRLEHEKLVAKKFFKQAKQKGFTIKINGVLEISMNE
ncbi:hypothetical protein [Maribacter sp. ACAM166]|uniref:hypothetical protein n=1 Tax=Maribacter sp. ACAM166 TaxID=2508996 RepID=UPI0010FF22B4|nr:hypothetical protein [Maribacter sp. ACAM166]TLP82615.1 hypothetical protein ES765_00145 [Maribacter sp. ACAM166]